MKVVVQLNKRLVHTLHCSRNGRHFKVTFIPRYMSKYVHSETINRSVNSRKSMKGTLFGFKRTCLLRL